MNITITGTSGFVGQNLSDYLKHYGNIIEKLSLRGDWDYPILTETIIHLAGIAHDTSNIYGVEEYYKVNRDLTAELFDEFLFSKSKNFFYFSSVKAAADSTSNILDENFKSNPQTHYGKSKLQAENYILSKKIPRGKKVFIIRPCMIHGQGNRGNLNLLYNLVKKGIPWPLASFENQRSFLSIDNLNFLILKILQNEGIPSGIYNFADDQFLSTNELVKIISNVSGRKGKLWKMNAKFVSGLAKIGDAVKLPLNSERLKKLTESYMVSNAKIKLALGIENLPITAEQGLIKTIKSFQK